MRHRSNGVFGHCAHVLLFNNNGFAKTDDIVVWGDCGRDGYVEMPHCWIAEQSDGAQKCLTWTQGWHIQACTNQRYESQWRAEWFTRMYQVDILWSELCIVWHERGTSSPPEGGLNIVMNYTPWQVRKYDELCDYIKSISDGVRAVTLDFEGRNKVYF